MAKIIGLANVKGGVGKSTLASNICVALYDRGISVALIDCDEQRNSLEPIQLAEPRIVEKTRPN